ncbi:MAG: hypothetical protein OEU84_03665 [Xanthomonadales bacterium]|nr:hypothetical protein [Xanthomonadales bacterium]MDH4018675.1 hypothetical protein [Xanthomonadales bacterium]
MGPGSILAFHQLMYWSAIAVIAICIDGRLWAKSLIVVVLGLLPPLWLHSATIWNDTGVVSSLLLAVACILLLKITGTHWVFVVGFLSLCYAQAAKQTALFAAIPLFYILCGAYFNSGGRTGRWPQTAMLAITLLLSSLVTVYFLNSTGVEKYTKWPTIAVWDLAAVSIAEQKVLIPTAILNYQDESAAETLDRLEKSFDPAVNGPLAEAANFFPASQYQQELSAAWLTLPRHYPASYLGHHARVFAHLLGIRSDEIHLAFEHRIIQNDLGLSLLNRNSKAFDTAIKWINLSTHTLIYRPWFYLVALLMILIPVSYRLRQNDSFGWRFFLLYGLQRITLCVAVAHHCSCHGLPLQPVDGGMFSRNDVLRI